MALKTCPHCGHNVSDQAIKCPSCGKDPRYTAFQLEQREQQHKKKRRAAGIIITIVVVIIATVCAIFLPNRIRYQKGIAYCEAADYEAAIEIFTSLGDYADSAELVQKSMLDYVNSHFTVEDPLTVKYAEKLNEQGYPGAENLYKRLCKWEATITHCADYNNPNSYPTYRDGDPFYFYVKFSGGEPGTALSFRYIFTAMPRYAHLDSIEKTGTGIVSSNDTWWYGWGDFPGGGPILVTIKIYNNATNELIAEDTVAFTAN